MYRFLAMMILVLQSVIPCAAADDASRAPNIVLIYADDIGYGDLSCYGNKCIRTPNVDRLASEGLRFTDGHSGSATCTPSRYAMLTGEYAWRKPGTGVLPGDTPLIIKPGRTTLPSMLHDAGYRTGVVGKWHLGLGQGKLDWNGEIKPGPLEMGFDYAFLMPATGDRVPCVYVENHRVVNLDPADPLQVSFGEPIGDEPTGKAHPELLRMGLTHGHDMTIVNGVSRIGYMSGGKRARWNDEDMADMFVSKADAFIERSVKEHPDKPFFLYFSTHDIHVPRLPHQRFAGKSGMGPRGDALLSFDDSVGAVLKTLDRLQLSENTLVILTSDNGPVIDDGYADEAVDRLGNHRPAGPLRGGKYSNFEAGTRVPFIVRWSGRVKPGVSDALVTQLDFLSSFAALVGQKYDASAAPDSENQLAALLGESTAGRHQLIEHATCLAVRKGTWKYIEPSNQLRKFTHTNTELGNDPEPQLYDLSKDLGENRSIAKEHPQVLAEMQAILAAEKARGMAIQKRR